MDSHTEGHFTSQTAVLTRDVICSSHLILPIPRELPASHTRLIQFLFPSFSPLLISSFLFVRLFILQAIKSLAFAPNTLSLGGYLKGFSQNVQLAQLLTH